MVTTIRLRIVPSWNPLKSHHRMSEFGQVIVAQRASGRIEGSDGLPSSSVWNVPATYGPHLQTQPPRYRPRLPLFRGKAMNAPESERACLIETLIKLTHAAKRARAPS